MAITELDMISYRGHLLPNTEFNRIGLLAAESMNSAVLRSHRLTERDPRFISQFVISNLRRLTLVGIDPMDDFLLFWEDASLIQTGPGTEYMVTFLMEVNSIFLGMIGGGDRSVIGMAASLYPKMPTINPRAGGDATTAERIKNYKSSQSYLDIPDTAKLTAIIESMPWVVIWIILSHCDHRILEILLDQLMVFIPAPGRQVTQDDVS